jgi:hypothetical protein
MVKGSGTGFVVGLVRLEANAGEAIIQPRDIAVAVNATFLASFIGNHLKKMLLKFGKAISVSIRIDITP